jgi:hypothetical protein
MSSTLLYKATKPAQRYHPKNSAYLRHNANAAQSGTGGNVKPLYFALLLAVCLTPAQEKSLPENSVEASIRHVTVINVANGSELKDQTVTIHRNRIASIAATQDSDNALPNSVGAHGAFLTPGLWDMHVHVHDVNKLPLYIASGVTGIRVMSGEKDTAAYRAELARQQPGRKSTLLAPSSMAVRPSGPAPSS